MYEEEKLYIKDMTPITLLSEDSVDIQYTQFVSQDNMNLSQLYLFTNYYQIEDP